MSKDQPLSLKLENAARILVLVGLFVFGFYVLTTSTEHVEDTREYDIRCVGDNGIYYAFVKDSSQWWRTAHGTLVVMDDGRRYTFNRRRCTYEPIDNTIP